jgi:tetratricopeptide (TPR) repeat protein
MNTDTLASASDLQQQAAYLIERRRYALAASVLATALSHYPDDSDLLFYSAQVDYLTDEKEQAFHTLQQVLSRSPHHFGARTLMFQLHQDRDEHAQSEQVLLDLLRDYPEHAWLYARYALLMYRTLHIEKAKALSKEALRLDPESEDALIACLFGELIDGKRGSQHASLAELIRKHPENESTAYMLVAHLTQQGRYAAARRIAIEILHMHPHSRQALETVVHLDQASHWSMLPLWPMNRWGWAASGVIYVLSVVILGLLRKHAPESAGPASMLLLAFVVYSWVYPPLFARWMKKRAGL